MKLSKGINSFTPKSPKGDFYFDLNFSVFPLGIKGKKRLKFN